MHSVGVVWIKHDVLWCKLVSTKPTRIFGAAGKATTTRLGLQEKDVSVYNTVPRTSCGCYQRVELLETHVRIARD